MEAGETQLPLPSQVLCAVNKLDDVSHDDGLQIV
jgi:hypothetical protein